MDNDITIEVNGCDDPGCKVVTPHIRHTSYHPHAITDTDRLNWIENNGFGAALVSDDDGHWAIARDGFQNVPMETPADINTNFFIGKEEWKNSIREAIDAQMASKTT